MSKKSWDRLSQVTKSTLKTAIKRYLGDECCLDEVADCLSAVSAQTAEKTLINDIYHVLQHYDLDRDHLDEDVFFIMKRKFFKFADSIDRLDGLELKEALSDLFNRPYSGG